MPYGAEVGKLDTVKVSGSTVIAVYPDVMRELGLKPGQDVDLELGEKIMAENEKLYLAKKPS